MFLHPQSQRTRVKAEKTGRAVGTLDLPSRTFQGFENVFPLELAMLFNHCLSGAIRSSTELGRHFDFELTAGEYFRHRSLTRLHR
jgi:hypothetical protein